MTTRKKIVCQFCDYTSCKLCASTYICELPGQAECMNCKKMWDRGNLFDKFGKHFLNTTYKRSRERHLFDREMSMMPATQTKVERIKYEQKVKAKIQILKTRVTELKRELYNFYVVDLESKRRKIEIQTEIFLLEKKIELKNFKLTHTERSSKKSVFVRKCPGNNCRGFLDGSWKCGLCETSFCKDCHEVFHVGHECDPATVETIKLMKSDSKPCPSCYTSISKIDGCDQMYCTMCNTAFSWRSGEIVTGRIHNPHYYEYLRRTNMTLREIGDVPCGGLPMRPPKVHNEENRKIIHGAHRLYFHIQEITMPTLRANDTEDYRVRYLLNHITVDDFKSAIHRIDKANAKKLEIRMVFTMFCEVLVDLFRNEIPHHQLATELLNLVEYTNQQFAKIGSVFDCKPPVIYQTVMSLYPPP